MESHILLYDERSRPDSNEGQLRPLLHPVTISVDFCGPKKPLPIGSSQRDAMSDVQGVSHLSHNPLFRNVHEPMNRMEQEQRGGRVEGTSSFSNGKNRHIANRNVPLRRKPSPSER